jgi:hypothetical protein
MAEVLMAGMDGDVGLVPHQQNLTVRRLVILVLGLNPRTRMTTLSQAEDPLSDRKPAHP